MNKQHGRPRDTSPLELNSNNSYFYYNSLSRSHSAWDSTIIPFQKCSSKIQGHTEVSNSFSMVPAPATGDRLGRVGEHPGKRKNSEKRLNARESIHKNDFHPLSFTDEETKAHRIKIHRLHVPNNASDRETLTGFQVEALPTAVHDKPSVLLRTILSASEWLTPIVTLAFRNNHETCWPGTWLNYGSYY